MSSSPLVSVIITNYNRAGMVGRAIQSVLDQDYKNIEVIVSDNCSTDNSDSVIKQFCSDKRIHYNRNDHNIGMIKNFRKATYELASGDFITYVNSDDFLVHNSFLTDAVNLINKDKEIDIVFGRMAFDSTTNNVLWETPVQPYFIKEIWDGKEVFFRSVGNWLFSWGACFMRKSAMLKVGAISEYYHNIDFDANYKIMLESKVGFINKLCYMQVGHESNAGFPVSAEKIIKSMECFFNITNYGCEILPERKIDFQNWRDHFLLYTINIGFHSLVERDFTQFKLFRSEVKVAYPEIFDKYVRSWKYRKMLLLRPVKKVLSPKFRTRVRKIFGI